MQRLFSTFPGGMPGAALLLLRAVLGVTLLAVCAKALAATDDDGRAMISGILAAASGSALLVGLITPLAALAGVVATVLAPHTWSGDSTGLTPGKPAMVLVVAIGVALALLGPGAFSLDCRLFGRREISFPPDSDRKER